MNAHKTPLEDAPFTSAQRRVAAKRLGVPQSAAPRNQFEYIQLLARAGATVLVNENAVHAFGLTTTRSTRSRSASRCRTWRRSWTIRDACLNYSRE